MQVKLQMPEWAMSRSMKALRRLQEAEPVSRDIRAEMRIIEWKRRAICETCGGRTVGSICVDGCGRR